MFSGPEALERLEQRHYDFVLSDIKMPGLNGVELCRAISASQPRLPVALMTAYSSHHLVRQGRQEGVLSVLSKPLDLDRLLRLCSLLERGVTVVVVDDDPLFCRTLEDVLSATGYCVSGISDPLDVPEHVSGDTQVAILDIKLGHTSGLDVLRQLRERKLQIQVILVSGYLAEVTSLVDQAMGLGVRSVFPKPVPMEELLAVLDDIRREVLSSALGGAGRYTSWPLGPPVS